jgi:hypothetical protein
VIKDIRLGRKFQLSRSHERERFAIFQANNGTTDMNFDDGRRGRPLSPCPEVTGVIVGVMHGVPGAGLPAAESRRWRRSADDT